jgi:hypothetical protein
VTPPPSTRRDLLIAEPVLERAQRDAANARWLAAAFAEANAAHVEAMVIGIQAETIDRSAPDVFRFQNIEYNH